MARYGLCGCVSALVVDFATYDALKSWVLHYVKLHNIRRNELSDKARI